MTGLVTFPVRSAHGPAADPRSSRGRAGSAGSGRLLVVACGAIARELIEVVRLQDLDGVEVTALPAELHNRPERIAEAVRAKVRAAVGRFDRVLVGYADCGTGGALDRVCEEEGVTRLPAAHCYELFAGSAAFAALHEREPGTFYLTDYLVRHAEVLVFTGLGLDEYPELLELYFGNYHRVVYLAQSDDPALDARARDVAVRLGLVYERRSTGLESLAAAVSSSVTSSVSSVVTDRVATVDP